MRTPPPILGPGRHRAQKPATGLRIPTRSNLPHEPPSLFQTQSKTRSGREGRMWTCHEISLVAYLP